MLRSLKYNILCLSVIIFIIADIHNLFCQEFTIAKLKSYYVPEVCSDNNEVLITVNIGNVSKADSLYAFDVLIKYDNQKFKPLGAVYMNTLSEFVKYRDVNIGFDTNMIRAFAFNMNEPFSGNKDLIGFYGRLTTDCLEPLEFRLLECDLTEDYKKKIDIDTNLIVNAIKKVDKNHNVEINLNRKELVFENNLQELIASIKINPYKEINEMFFDIYLDNIDNFEIINIEMLNELLVLDYYNKINDNHYELKFNSFGNINNSEIFKINLNSWNKTTNDINTKIIITPREYDFCHCYNSFIADTTYLISKPDKDTTVDIVNYSNNNIKISIKDDFIEIENYQNNNINMIRVYDILGNNIFYSSVQDNNRYIKYKFNTNLTAGAYFVNVVINNKDTNKLIIIYN